MCNNQKLNQIFLIIRMEEFLEEMDKLIEQMRLQNWRPNGQPNWQSILQNGSRITRPEEQTEKQKEKETALKLAQRENEIAQLEAEHNRLVADLPQALTNREKALAELAVRKASGKYYDCSCGTGRTEFCDKWVCAYGRIRGDEYINGPISHANYIEHRIVEILAEIERKKAVINFLLLNKKLRLNHELD